ncbi:protoheme IX farnesyltransferase, partial [Candidatus Liberibacter sp.]|uniref:protoheme IX farnesyltransferase n=1 Tax=Candidatus Liberibacter sp. TaxID=34022 RepID=UPI0015F74E81
EVLVFGLCLSALAISILGLISNWVSAGLLSLSIFFYAVVYTVYLKRCTPQNIVIGGIAGALPPMIGWSVVTGEVSIDSFVMFLIIFLWTPPHFWSLALLNKDDYAKAGIPMLPNVATERVTKINILAYTVLTAIAGVLPAILGFVSMAYGLIASFLGFRFILGALRMTFSCGGEKIFLPARKLFLFSITYLFALFSALMFDYLIGMTVILDMFLISIKDGLF